MNERTRQLMLRVCDGCPAVPPILYHLYHFRRRDEIFRWLVEHAYTGAVLAQVFRGEHGGSFLRLGAWVISRIDGAPIRPVLADRDYLTAF